jgi:hypothetical protein
VLSRILTQARFAHGHRNVHLASLIADSGCVPYLVGFLDEAEACFDLGHRATKREEFASLVFSPSTHSPISRSIPRTAPRFARTGPRFDKFWLNSLSVMHAADIFHFWNSFSPFACLLDAPHPHIARWALRCLCEFARDGVPRVFRALAVVSSVDSVRYWCTVEETAQYAESLVQLLGVDGEPGQPHVLAPPPATGAPALDRQALAAFSDIDLVVIDDEGREANCIGGTSRGARRSLDVFRRALCVRHARRQRSTHSNRRRRSGRHLQQRSSLHTAVTFRRTSQRSSPSIW